jgi:hypothetical protein
MADGDPSDQIASIEANIEQLAEGLYRCRKAMLLSKVAIAVGASGLHYFPTATRLPARLRRIAGTTASTQLGC